MDKDLEQEIKRLVEEGYMAEDGHPLKCHMCDEKKMEEKEIWYGDYGRIDEYTLRCSACKTVTGHWAYGGWSL